MLMFIVDRLLRPYGYGWVALVVGAVAFVGLGWLSWRQRDPLDRKIGAWLSAGLDEQARSAAIDEARKLLAHFAGGRSKLAKSRAHRVRLALAELLCADAQYDQAEAVLQPSDPPSDPDQAFSLGLAQATVALRRKDAETCERALGNLPHSGSALLNAQKDLLEIALLLERNEASDALKKVNATRPRCAAFPSLQLQLRLYHAAALKLLGQQGEADEIVAALDQPARLSARVYGLPPIRTLV